MQYVKVIIPLKLDWEPWYSSSQELHPGERVRVSMAEREYVGVVSSVGGVPDIDESRILPILGIADGLEDVTAGEMRLWRFVAEYYMCTIGEVYKIVYPAVRTAAEERKSRAGAETGAETGGNRRTGADTFRHKTLQPSQKEAVIRILDGFDEHKTVLLRGTGREDIYRELARRQLEAGHDVLLLRSGVASPDYLWRVEAAKAVKGSVPTLIEGHRSNIFLPFSKLGLVIVDEEESPTYKQTATAPLYQARDTAIALAAMQGSDVLLGSELPSAESMYNAACGKYLSVELPDADLPAGVIPEIIDTSEEERKYGMMPGWLSRKMLSAVQEAQASRQKVLILSPWADTTETEYQFRQQIRDNRFDFRSMRGSLGKGKKKAPDTLNVRDIGEYGTVVVMDADILLDSRDFRADETAFRTLEGIAKASRGRLIIQTRNASHPVFKAIAAGVRDISAALLAERARFGYPPFTRLVELRLCDNNGARLAKMNSELSASLGGLQFFLPKDRSLSARKREIAAKVHEFEEAKRYRGHIVIDVDPA